MDTEITERMRSAMLLSSVVRVAPDRLREGLALTADPRFSAPNAVGNAVNTLRRHRHPSSVLGKAQYRAVVPYVAAALADACLARTIEVLGDAADEPTRQQLLDALDVTLQEFPVENVAVMLASVAAADMEASDLCFDVLMTDHRFGLTEAVDSDPDPDPDPDSAPDSVPAGNGPGQVAAHGPTPEQRAARRLKKRQDAEERRKKSEAARRGAELARRARKRQRTPAASAPPDDRETPDRTGSVAPRLTRRAHLTPAEERAFERDDPWVGGVVFAWIPFGSDGNGGDDTSDDTSDTPDIPDDGVLDGKARRCVVIAGSESHLLVRPGYSEGGAMSRDWKSVPVRYWRRSGFDRPTWIETEVVQVLRQGIEPPVGRLESEDWNALW